jgi:hypothetical protein
MIIENVLLFRTFVAIVKLMENVVMNYLKEKFAIKIEFESHFSEITTLIPLKV